MDRYCCSCADNRKRGRAAYRKLRPGTNRCDDCGLPVCKLHTNRDDGAVRCAGCARADRREAARRVQGLGSGEVAS